MKSLNLETMRTDALSLNTVDRDVSSKFSQSVYLIIDIDRFMGMMYFPCLEWIKIANINFQFSNSFDRDSNVGEHL